MQMGVMPSIDREIVERNGLEETAMNITKAMQILCTTTLSNKWSVYFSLIPK